MLNPKPFMLYFVINSSIFVLLLIVSSLIVTESPTSMPVFFAISSIFNKLGNIGLSALSTRNALDSSVQPSIEIPIPTFNSFNRFNFFSSSKSPFVTTETLAFLKYGLLKRNSFIRSATNSKTSKLISGSPP